MAKKQKNSEKQEAEQVAPPAPPVDAIPAAEPNSDLHPVKGFPVVGIGASAGGLAAFEAFFAGMPADIDPANEELETSKT